MRLAARERAAVRAARAAHGVARHAARAPRHRSRVADSRDAPRGVRPSARSRAAVPAGATSVSPARTACESRSRPCARRATTAALTKAPRTGARSTPRAAPTRSPAVRRPPVPPAAAAARARLDRRSRVRPAPFTTISLALPRPLAPEHVVSRARDDGARAQRPRDGQRALVHDAEAGAATAPSPTTTARARRPPAGATMTDARRALPSVGALLESAPSARAARRPRRARSSWMRCAPPWRTPATSRHGAERRRRVGRGDRRPARRVRRARRCAASSTRRGSCCTRTSVARRSPTRRSTRSPRSPAATATSSSTSTRGARGSRYVHCAALLRELTGAEDALVVNNCAAALVLALNTLADGREAILSRGELVEIGGSFRVHEIMAKSGARLREVGATNRTHLADYERAIGARHGRAAQGASQQLRACTASPPRRRCASSRRSRARTALPILHDLGSGLLVSLETIGLRGEPTAREALEAGATIVVMSGDKLLGGPQAGIDRRRRDAGSTRCAESARALVSRRQADARRARGDARALSRSGARAARDPHARAPRRAAPTRSASAPTRCGARSRATVSPARRSRRRGSVGAGAFPDAAAPGRRGRARRRRRGVGARDCARDRPRSSAASHDGRMHLDLRAVLATELPELARAVVAARG